jgi:U4/U6.U5 tri-snRNP-associated protein 3
MMNMFGFGDFETSKNREHIDESAVSKEFRNKRTYRQYMNRRGGFNRPLDRIV